MGDLDKGILYNQNNKRKVPNLHSVPQHWSSQISSHRTLTVPPPATYWQQKAYGYRGLIWDHGCQLAEISTYWFLPHRINACWASTICQSKHSKSCLSPSPMVGLVYFYTMLGVLLKLVGCTISNDVFPEDKLGASIYKIGSFYMFSPLMSAICGPWHRYLFSTICIVKLRSQKVRKVFQMLGSAL